MKLKLFTYFAFFIFILQLVTPAFAEGELNWIVGPTTVDVGDLATIELGEDYVFLNKEDTVAFNNEIGNYETGLEIGSIYPASEEEDWFIIFEYDDTTGYIENPTEEKIDADEILASYKEGNEDANKELEKDGFAPINVIGWTKEPYFDSKTKNLAWALELESEGESIVNYNVRLLNRYGSVSAVLVADSSDLERLIPEVDRVLEGFSFKEGQRYEDFDPKKDKIAQFGLAALITGGAGVAAVKSGLLATLLVFVKKFGILIVAAIGGVIAYFKKIKGKKE